MSTATANTASTIKAQSVLARVSAPANLVVIGVLTAAFILLFHNWFFAQHLHSWGSGDWSHAYFVPLVSLYLLWQHRRELDRVRLQTYWPGLLAMLTGVFSYVYFIAGFPNHFGQGLALILTLFGLVLLMLGPKAMELCFFPIAYLIFAVTLPEKVMNAVTWPLQNLAAQGGYVMLNTFGVRTDITGNVLTVYDSKLNAYPLNVAEACSGMRMLIAFLALAGAVALVGTREWWKRVILLALAGPVALFINMVRVAVLGVLSLLDTRLAGGEAHMFIGTLLLIPGFALFMLILLALNKAVPESKPEPLAAPSNTITPGPAVAGGGSLAQ